MNALRRMLIAVLATASMAAHATDPESAERAVLAKKRSAVQAQFAAEDRECASRFSVNACVDDVRARRREALTAIDARDAELDAAQRKRRADERRAGIASKQAERAKREAQSASGPVAPQPLDALRAPSPPKGAPVPRPASSHPAPNVPTPAQRAAREQAARERYEAKQRDAAAHRAEIERRNAAEKKEPAAALPPVSASAMPASSSR